MDFIKFILKIREYALDGGACCTMIELYLPEFN